MKAMLEPKMVAASTHLPEARGQGSVTLPARMTLSSQGCRIEIKES
jgi:hypothetical protein